MSESYAPRRARIAIDLVQRGFYEIFYYRPTTEPVKFDLREGGDKLKMQVNNNNFEVALCDLGI